MTTINEQNIRIDPMFIMITSRFFNGAMAMCAYVETNFDFDAMFGTHTKYRENEHVNVYAMYIPGKSIHLEYFVETDDDFEGPYVCILSPEESNTILRMMEQIAMDRHGMPLDELYREWMA